MSAKPKRTEHTLIAYVTVTVPVNLVFETGELITEDELRTAAVDNFCTHPAVSSPADLLTYVDHINYAFSKP